MEKLDYYDTAEWLVNSDQYLPADLVAKMFFKSGDVRDLCHFLTDYGIIQKGSVTGNYKDKILLSHIFLPYKVHSSCIVDLVGDYKWWLQIKDSENNKKQGGEK